MNIQWQNILIDCKIFMGKYAKATWIRKRIYKIDKDLVLCEIVFGNNLEKLILSWNGFRKGAE